MRRCIMRRYSIKHKKEITKDQRKKDPFTRAPSYIIRAHYMPIFNMKVAELAAKLNMNEHLLSKYILTGAQPVTIPLAIKLSRVFNTTAKFWVNKQREANEWTADKGTKLLW